MQMVLRRCTRRSSETPRNDGILVSTFKVFRWNTSNAMMHILTHRGVLFCRPACRQAGTNRGEGIPPSPLHKQGYAVRHRPRNDNVGRPGREEVERIFLLFCCWLLYAMAGVCLFTSHYAIVDFLPVRVFSSCGWWKKTTATAYYFWQNTHLCGNLQSI